MERRQGSPTDRGAVGSTRSDFKLCCGPLPCVCMTSLLLRSVHRRVGLFTGGWVRPAAPGGSKTMLWEECHMGEGDGLEALWWADPL